MVGVSQGSADSTMDVSSKVKPQGEALGGPALLWAVISHTEPSGSPQIHGVSIQYLTQIAKMVGKNPHLIGGLPACRDWVWHLCGLFALMN